MKDDLVKSPLDCVDPSVGRRLWELEEPDLDPSSRSLLEAHVAVCDACREVVRLDERVQELVREGYLGEPLRGPGRGWGRAVPIAALSLAASLSLFFVLPPRPTAETGPVRGVPDRCFTRPVEGEVVAASRPLLRWTPIEGVTRYRVEIRDREARTVWVGESDVPEIRVDEGAGLGPGREYRALLSVRPADLAPPAPASVVFRSGSWGDMLLHRARWAHPWLQVLTVLSLGFLSFAWLGRRRSREAQSA